MTALPLLALAGYFLILFEYIAMRHRDICAESDARIERAFRSNRRAALWKSSACFQETDRAEKLYWNRGTK